MLCFGFRDHIVLKASVLLGTVNIVTQVAHVIFRTSLSLGESEVDADPSVSITFTLVRNEIPQGIDCNTCCIFSVSDVF